MKKAIVFFLLLTFSKLVLCQEESKRGTITVDKPTLTNTGPCSATVLGYSGKNNIPRSKLFKFEKIELNEGCNYKIVSFQLAYLSNDATIKLNTTGELISPETISAIQNTGYVKFDQIVAKDLEYGNQKTLPPIVFVIE
jgi:hypothetical protein